MGDLFCLFICVATGIEIQVLCELDTYYTTEPHIYPNLMA